MRFRADSASFQKEVVGVVECNSRSFYIRAKYVREDGRHNLHRPKEDWEKFRLGMQGMEVANIPGYPCSREASLTDWLSA